MESQITDLFETHNILMISPFHFRRVPGSMECELLYSVAARGFSSQYRITKRKRKPLQISLWAQNQTNVNLAEASNATVSVSDKITQTIDGRKATPTSKQIINSKLSQISDNKKMNSKHRQASKIT
ncbi:hypothetical protein PoB_004788200 [Plakobranchus ocellatus]|uniref:Uncharacterized protein n=1 Tax=Plakobranchus ocellatus TaxID=259542 RepID=A0AAV4BQX7_9GAST|nr:hypothetical protein PoB_004788200 [Plakobranchus ocellatus]